MKKMFFFGCLVLGMFAVQAQDTTQSMKIQADGTGSVSPFALQVHLGEGWGDYPGLDGDATTDHRITAGGVSGHYSLNCHWSAVSELARSAGNWPLTTNPDKLLMSNPRWFWVSHAETRRARRQFLMWVSRHCTHRPPS